MKLKFLLVGGFVLFFFLGEIAVSFSFKRESDRNIAFSDVVPLSYKVIEQQLNDTNTVVIDSFVNDFLIRNKIKGASLAIAKDGRLVYAKGFGLANIDDSCVVEPWNLFRIASVSKLITAVTIMKLIEEEKLSLGDKVFGKNGILNDSCYLSYTDTRVEDITIHQLLNHTGGWNSKMGDPVFNSLYVARKQHITPPAEITDIIEYALSQPLSHQPGEAYHYSNLGYCILGQVIEKITGMPYESYVQFAILHPLGIYDMHIGYSYESDLFVNEVRYYENQPISGRSMAQKKLCRRPMGATIFSCSVPQVVG
jgi:CubicO group peptidase (beta-lactamase class C family)